MVCQYPDVGIEYWYTTSVSDDIRITRLDSEEMFRYILCLHSAMSWNILQAFLVLIFFVGIVILGKVEDQDIYLVEL